MNTAVTFINYTDEDFTHTWDSQPYVFAAGRTMMLPEYLARHFAKHLTRRELNKLGPKGEITDDDPEFIKLMNKCVVLDSEVSATTKLGLEVAMMNTEKPVTEVKEPEAPKKRMGRPPKVKKAEDSFEGLSDATAL